MTTRHAKYYEAYDDRYRRVYVQGVPYWTGDPAEMATTIQHVDDLFHYAGIAPASHSIIEFGCGEGFLAEYLLSKGDSYLGMDPMDDQSPRMRRCHPLRAWELPLERKSPWSRLMCRGVDDG